MAADVKQNDGRASRWDQHRAERRAELVEAAVRAIDREGPDVPLAEIAREAGVSKPVLYRYFADKDQLHVAVGNWSADQVLERVVPALLSDKPVRERIQIGVSGYLGVIAAHPEVFRLLVRHRSDSDPLADGKARIAAVVTRIFGEALRRAGADASGAEVWANGVVGTCLAVGEWWVEHGTMSRKAVDQYLALFVWHAVDGAAEEIGLSLPSLGPDED
jgi:AcrR family transcriptional regulator